MMSLFLPLSLNPPFTHKTSFFLSKSSLPTKPFICFSSPTNPPDFEPEEIRWLREEQRWLREEQRWLREEQRWIRDRESLLREISKLKLQIQTLQSQTQGASVTDTIANIAGLLQVLKEKDLIAESGSSGEPMVRVLGAEKEKEEKVEVEVKKRKDLRKGSEGEEVRTMQEALQKLGFYSGEEDMEYSSFSSGTERAVKTWQATLGGPEDGIMTAELLERLYMEQPIEGAGLNIDLDQKGSTLSVSQKESANGAAVASVTEISEIKQTVVKEESVTDVKASHHRVFLLGENRWEEPSRLVGREKKFVRSQTNAMKKCLTCRGEGRLMCTECDGSGEPNIEPQFLEWVDEGAKCPYCEGQGFTICDVCEGKTMI